MSFEAIKWAFAQDVSGAFDQLVLLHLANHADTTGVAWPSRDTLAKEAHCSVSAVKRAIANLEAAGFVVKRTRQLKTGAQTSNIYVLNMTSTTSEPSPPDDRTPALTEPPPGSHRTSPRLSQNPKPIKRNYHVNLPTSLSPKQGAKARSEQGIKNPFGPAAPASVGAALKYRVEGYGLPADDMAARAEREAPRAPSARFIRLARDELCRRLPGIGNGLAEAAVKGMAGPSQTVMTLLVQAAGR